MHSPAATFQGFKSLMPAPAPPASPARPATLQSLPTATAPATLTASAAPRPCVDERRSLSFPGLSKHQGHTTPIQAGAIMPTSQPEPARAPVLNHYQPSLDTTAEPSTVTSAKEPLKVRTMLFSKAAAGLHACQQLDQAQCCTPGGAVSGCSAVHVVGVSIGSACSNIGLLYKPSSPTFVLPVGHGRCSQ